jgi:hypothetical protein
MSEDMGPYYFGASAKVLAALSPTTNEEASRWREKCRARLSCKTSIKVGDVFAVKVAITFKGKRGVEVGTFASVCEVKRTKVVMLAPSFGLFSMSIDHMGSFLTPADAAPAPVAPAPAPAKPARMVTTVEDALAVLADADADTSSIDAALALLA